MTILESSLELAKQNVRLFQCVYGAKIPAVDKFSERATSDPKKLTEMFSKGTYNSGIACGYVAENFYHVGVDIDLKDGRNGYNTLLELEMQGFEMPESWSQETPTGGMHILLWSPVPIRQGANVLGPGVDLRGDGGYLMGPESVINGVPYKVTKDIPICRVPNWMIEKYEKKAQVIELHKKPQNSYVQDQVLALKRSVEFLNSLEPTITGSRNDECYRIVCKMKDFGLDKSQMLDILNTFWKIEDPLEDFEMSAAINSAFKYGKNEPGVAAPENVFDKIEILPPEKEKKCYIEEYNEKYFYCADNGTSRVCEQTEIDGHFHLKRYSVHTFHEMMLPDTIKVQREDKIKTVQKSQEWMKNEKRRSYKEIRFIPKPSTPQNTFNLWRGFHSKPATDQKIYSKEAHEGFEKFILHCLENICDNDGESYEYLMSWIAHMFQKPWEKPPVAIVQQGEKGTGKNALVDCLHHMIGRHSITVAGKHTLTSNFNSAMEDKILVALDEAFWSGDKSAEGILKSLITEERRKIERKGEEPYFADVFDRIIIIGNEEQLVNATGDERRFAVYNVTNKRQNDTEFFGAMKDGVRKHGGDELLMQYFLNRDISKFNVRRAPETEGLREQKYHSLSGFQSWWRECLVEGRIIGSYDGGTTWPSRLLQKDLVQIYGRYEKENFSNKYPLSGPTIGKQFKRIAASCSDRKSVKENGQTLKMYEFCPLNQARKEWNESMKLKEIWD